MLCFYETPVLRFPFLPYYQRLLVKDKSSSSYVFSGKGVLKIWSKFTEEHPCQSVTSIKLLCNFIKITFWHCCSPVNMLHIFRTPILENTYKGLLLSGDGSWGRRKFSLQFPWKILLQFFLSLFSHKLQGFKMAIMTFLHGLLFFWLRCQVWRQGY